MPFRLPRFILSTARWLLALFGAVALILAAMLAVPLSYPATLESITRTAKTFDHAGMPDLSRFQARDGTTVAYRAYPATAPDSGRVAVLLHGSSASSSEMHTLAKALAARGIGAYALDVRGHGASGTRGDIGYIGQLEDDLADFVGVIRLGRPDAPIVLIGHSSGGGFALRVAGSPIQTLFSKTILLAPYLGIRAPTSRPNAGGWASPDLPRILAITFLGKLGLSCCEALPTLTFAVPPHSTAILTSVYSFRLMTNYATHFDYRDDLRAATRPIAVIAGADDELMVSNLYATAMSGGRQTIPVHLVPGIDHMAVVAAPAATATIVAEALTN
jgi:alpha-beta hydrolase superfamily lysophospholipase